VHDAPCLAISAARNNVHSGRQRPAKIDIANFCAMCEPHFCRMLPGWPGNQRRANTGRNLDHLARCSALCNSSVPRANIAPLLLGEKVSTVHGECSILAGLGASTFCRSASKRGSLCNRSSIGSALINAISKPRSSKLFSNQRSASSLLPSPR
jgi:hypothetical protein